MEQAAVQALRKKGLSKAVVAQAPEVPKTGLRKLERQLPEVSGENELAWPNQPKVVVKTEEAPQPEPDVKSGTIEPMSNDWLPPGVTRVK